MLYCCLTCSGSEKPGVVVVQLETTDGKVQSRWLHFPFRIRLAAADSSGKLEFFKGTKWTAKTLRQRIRSNSVLYVVPSNWIATLRAIPESMQHRVECAARRKPFRLKINLDGTFIIHQQPKMPAFYNFSFKTKLVSPVTFHVYFKSDQFVKALLAVEDS